MIKICGLEVVRISKNGKKAICVMQNGNKLWSEFELPSGYTFLEYIESNGSQYIDTGFKPNNNTRVLMDVETLSTPSATVSFFGVRTSATSKNYAFLYASSIGKLRSDYNNAYTQEFNFIVGRFLIDKNKEMTTVSGVSSSYMNSSFQCDYNLCLFASNNAGSAAWKSSIRVYSCKIYDNNKLIRDFIPAKDSNDVPGLYDMENNVFYKSATSTDFIAGPEIENPFTILEYIEATGEQYINTRVVPNVNTSFIAELSIPVGIGNKNLFCAYTNYVLNSKSDTQLEYRIGSSSWVHITTPSAVTSKFKVEFSTKAIKFNGSVIASPNISTLSNSYPMWLFYREGGTSTYMGYGKLYSCQIYDNGELVRDFVPVIRYDGTCGLYDKVNKAFYGSASSTPFTGA